jgi:hypothetical protein
MNSSPANLPVNYQPFGNLDVCSNTLSGGGGIPFQIGESYPLLIGWSETVPLIWIRAPRDPDGKAWTELVSANQILHQGFQVAAEAGLVSVHFQGRLLVTVRQSSQDSAQVEVLDLRPIGLNVYGSGDGLTAGTVRMVNSAFFGASVMIKLG